MMTQQEEIHLVGMIGSLRRGSYNRQLFEVLRQLAPAHVQFSEASIGDLPHFNEDVEKAGLPDVVARLGQQLDSADGVLIISPEYNHSLPGVLKNALDWASRLPSKPFRNKPVAILGASQGALGTVRMQLHLRPILGTALGARLVNAPEIFVGGVQTKLNAEGVLQDEMTATFLKQHLQALITLIGR